MVGPARRTEDDVPLGIESNTRLFEVDRLPAPRTSVDSKSLEVNILRIIVFTERIFGRANHFRSEEHTSELQSLMRISYAVFCLKKKKKKNDKSLKTI